MRCQVLPRFVDSGRDGGQFRDRNADVLVQRLHRVPHKVGITNFRLLAVTSLHKDRKDLNNFPIFLLKRITF